MSLARTNEVKLMSRRNKSLSVVGKGWMVPNMPGVDFPFRLPKKTWELLRGCQCYSCFFGNRSVPLWIGHSDWLPAEKNAVYCIYGTLRLEYGIGMQENWKYSITGFAFFRNKIDALASPATSVAVSIGVAAFRGSRYLIVDIFFLDTEFWGCCRFEKGLFAADNFCRAARFKKTKFVRLSLELIVSICKDAMRIDDLSAPEKRNGTSTVSGHLPVNFPAVFAVFWCCHPNRTATWYSCTAQLLRWMGCGCKWSFAGGNTRDCLWKLWIILFVENRK